MYGTKLCLNLIGGTSVSPENLIGIYKNAGLDGFFTGCSGGLAKYRALADELGMIYQSIHAPFGKAAKIWRGGDDAEAATNELIYWTNECAAVNVPIFIVHPYIGFEDTACVTDSGIENFRKVVENAAAKGVKIAFENVEGEEYLAALMDTFKSYENVGFCWDSGHEMCYNRGKDMLALYGDRLIATHINDNLGVRDFDGKITFHDDLHLLPFDGIIDWKKNMDRLNGCGYNGILTFELSIGSKPNRFENEKYKRLNIYEYVAEVYARACRLAYLKNKM
ncbi:MAG: sugar phosphate isomerase/epimerase [Clostridia bacterium]|nr:sugar phosphate isomerase/epimerase [Clostridia bacterium]